MLFLTLKSGLYTIPDRIYQTYPYHARAVIDFVIKKTNSKTHVNPLAARNRSAKIDISIRRATSTQGGIAMATAEHLIFLKGAELASLDPNASVLDAAKLMNERHIGSVLVIENDRVVGIFTERDVMRRVVAEQLNPATTQLADVMTSPVACGSNHTSLNELRNVMRQRKIRHVPIVDRKKKALGMISIGDLNQAEHDVQEQTIQYLEQYMSVS